MRATSAALVGDDVEEAGVLVGEAVVILAPDEGGDEEVDGGDGRAPGGSCLDFSSHLACWLNMESMTWTKAS